MNPVLKFIRKTPWAKEKIERIYRDNLDEIAANKIQLAKNPKKSLSVYNSFLVKIKNLAHWFENVGNA